MMERTRDWWDELASAIVRQAAMDYQKARNALIAGASGQKAITANRMYIEAKAFFFTDWYKDLTQLPAEYLIKQLDTVPIEKLKNKGNRGRKRGQRN